MKVIELNMAALDVRYSGLRVRDRRREAQLMASLEEHGQQDAISVIAGRRGAVGGGRRAQAGSRAQAPAA